MDGWKGGGKEGGRQKEEENLIQVGSKELRRLYGNAGAERRDRHRIS